MRPPSTRLRTSIEAPEATETEIISSSHSIMPARVTARAAAALSTMGERSFMALAAAPPPSRMTGTMMARASQMDQAQPAITRSTEKVSLVRLNFSGRVKTVFACQTMPSFTVV